MTSIMFAYRKNRFLTSIIVKRHGCDHQCVYAIVDWYHDQPQKKQTMILSELLSV